MGDAATGLVAYDGGKQRRRKPRLPFVDHALLMLQRTLRFEVLLRAAVCMRACALVLMDGQVFDPWPFELVYGPYLR